MRRGKPIWKARNAVLWHLIEDGGNQQIVMGRVGCWPINQAKRDVIYGQP